MILLKKSIFFITFYDIIFIAYKNANLERSLMKKKWKLKNQKLEVTISPKTKEQILQNMANTFNVNWIINDEIVMTHPVAKYATYKIVEKVKAENLKQFTIWVQDTIKVLNTHPHFTYKSLLDATMQLIGKNLKEFKCSDCCDGECIYDDIYDECKCWNGEEKEMTIKEAIDKKVLVEIDWEHKHFGVKGAKDKFPAHEIWMFYVTTFKYKTNRVMKTHSLSTMLINLNAHYQKRLFKVP